MVSRFALYWHNGRGLGHTARSAKLGAGLLGMFPGSAVIGITGANKGLELLPKEMDVIKLPSFISQDLGHVIKVKPIMPVSLRELIYYRSRIIDTFMNCYQPDAWIIDFEPQGKDGELIPAISTHRNIRKILGIRGIIKSPDATNKEFFSKEMCDFIERHYEAIHVYTDPQLVDIVDFYTIPLRIASKIHYTGYVSDIFDGDKSEARKLLNLPPDEKMILISFGGGEIVNKVWKSVILSLQGIYPHYDKTIIIAGPYMSTETKGELLSLTKDHPYLQLSEMKKGFHIWMKACDLFIGSGGYNTIADILANNVNALLMTNQRNETEQQIHLKKLGEKGIVRTIGEENLEHQDIKALIIEALKIPYPASAIPFMVCGAQENAKLLTL